MATKVMIVDDNEDLRFSIKEGLKDISANYEYMEAADGKECLEKLKSGQVPDLILLDIMMPNMDGWEVSAEIQKNDDWRKIPIVFLTAKTDDVSKGLGSVVSADYIEKPFEIVDLKARIDKVLSKK